MDNLQDSRGLSYESIRKEDLFSAEGFVDELENQGICVGKNVTIHFFGNRAVMAFTCLDIDA
ncbi:MAG: hypothetical protein QOH96_2349 [Blastocatellia bacterium]|nr:hypothetical protein [Blastocatellia bacterium]